MQSKQTSSLPFFIAAVILMALVFLFCGCSTPATKGWTIGGPCPVCNYPLVVVDSQLEAATAVHPNGGEVLTEDCINPDTTHETLVTNYYNVPVPGVPTWKP